MLPNVLTYFDFLKFIADLRAALPYEGRTKITLETLGEFLGISSRGTVSMMLSGRRKIPDGKVELLSKALGLSDREDRYFQNLVRYNQADRHRIKKNHFDRMVAELQIANKELIPAQYRLCERWYYPIVHELLRLVNIQENFEELGLLVRPCITAHEAKQAISVLKAIGLAEKNKLGFWKPKDRVLDFGEGWKSLVVREFQKQSFDRAQNSLEDTPYQERQVSCQIICIGDDSFHLLKERLLHLQKEVEVIGRMDKNANRVYQLNLSLVPVTEIAVEEKDI